VERNQAVVRQHAGTGVDRFEDWHFCAGAAGGGVRRMVSFRMLGSRLCRSHQDRRRSMYSPIPRPKRLIR
jgi:hypothetical protein